MIWCHAVHYFRPLYVIRQGKNIDCHVFSYVRYQLCEILYVDIWLFYEISMKYFLLAREYISLCIFYNVIVAANLTTLFIITYFIHFDIQAPWAWYHRYRYRLYLCLVQCMQYDIISTLHTNTKNNTRPPKCSITQNLQNIQFLLKNV